MTPSLPALHLRLVGHNEDYAAHPWRKRRLTKAGPLGTRKADRLATEGDASATWHRHSRRSCRESRTGACSDIGFTTAEGGPNAQNQAHRTDDEGSRKDRSLLQRGFRIAGNPAQPERRRLFDRWLYQCGDPQF